MKTSKHVQELLARWPAGGLVHGYERKAGEGFDCRRSEMLRWLLDQPETWEWFFIYGQARGWFVFRDGRWFAGDADGAGVRRARRERAGKAGAGQSASKSLPAPLLLECLRELGGAARWDEWRKAAMEKSGERVGKLWGFYHAIKPLLAVGQVKKCPDHRYRITDSAPAPAADLDDWNPETPREIMDPIKRKLLAATPATEAGALDQDTIFTAAGRDPKGPREHRMAYQEAWIELETVDFSVRFVGAGRFCRAAAAPSSQPAPEVVEV